MVPKCLWCKGRDHFRVSPKMVGAYALAVLARSMSRLTWT